MADSTGDAAPTPRPPSEPNLATPLSSRAPAAAPAVAGSSTQWSAVGGTPRLGTAAGSEGMEGPGIMAMQPPRPRTTDVNMHPFIGITSNHNPAPQQQAVRFRGGGAGASASDESNSSIVPPPKPAWQGDVSPFVADQSSKYGVIRQDSSMRGVFDESEYEARNAHLQREANEKIRGMCCVCSCLAIFVLILCLGRPPQGSPAWHGASLCLLPSAALPETFCDGSSEAICAEAQTWIQANMTATAPSNANSAAEAASDGSAAGGAVGVGCPASPMPGPDELVIERSNVPTFGGAFDRFDQNFFVKVLRSPDTYGSITFSIKASDGRTLLQPVRETLSYMTEFAVACNDTTLALCDKVDTVTDASSRRRLAHLASRSAESTKSSSREGHRDGRGGGEGAVYSSSAYRPSPTGRQLLKGGSSGTHSSGTHSSFGGGGSRSYSGRSAWVHSRTVTHGGGPYVATSSRFSRPAAVGVGTTYLLLYSGHHHHHYYRHHGEDCDGEPCVIVAETAMSQDDFLDTEFTVSGKDFPLRFTLLSVDLSVISSKQGGSRYTGGEPQLAFAFEKADF
mmetsp:Transcript_29686/g.79718  ORF Transcript_29686/g.79718 Transcript_29686/m.79718 type:complete len:566 (-) Transcript_29686:589-2286(-)